MPVPTPHIAAKAGDIAKTVLMPGDPLRSKFIAETFLENPVLVNNVRGVQGYTGTWKGVPVTVDGLRHGHPVASASTAGSCTTSTMWTTSSASAPPVRIADDLKLMDVVAGRGRLHGLQLRAPVRPQRHLRAHRGLYAAQPGRRRGGRQRRHACTWATSSRPTTSTTTATTAPTSGRRWACSPWRWRPPACT